MIIKDCPLSGLKTVQLAFFSDERGRFCELFKSSVYVEAGLPAVFQQDNISRSIPGVVRGLHFQYSPPQGKLVSVIRGEILDVAVDIRANSATFGQYFSIHLSEDNGMMLWIPAGFAHGFAVLGDGPADVIYKTTTQYNREGESGIRFDDPDLAIKWNITNPIVSQRDKQLPLWSEVQERLG